MRNNNSCHLLLILCQLSIQHPTPMLCHVYCVTLFAKCLGKGHCSAFAFGTGKQVKVLLERCLWLLCYLCHNCMGRVEYIRTISVALALWTPWHDALPACCHVEEMTEAMLSRLSSRCKLHHTFTSIDRTAKPVSIEYLHCND